jgi:hypothetical protein
MGVMSLSSQSPPPSQPDEPPPLVCWRSWPFRQNLAQSGLVLAGLLAAGLGVRGVTGFTHLALLAVAALALSLWRFFLPVVFTLSADGVNESLLGRERRIPWFAIRRFEVYPKGVLLLPYTDAARVDCFQGIFLPWGDHRQEILTLLTYYLGGVPNF